jgi:hypothetical protein
VAFRFTESDVLRLPFREPWGMEDNADFERMDNIWPLRVCRPFGANQWCRHKMRTLILREKTRFYQDCVINLSVRGEQWMENVPSQSILIDLWMTD